MKYRWQLSRAQSQRAAALAGELKISALMAQCLLNRGLTDAAAIGLFLEPRLKQLRDPFLLPDMEPAVARLLRARERRESMVIFGDYDVDGVTSTALMSEVLRTLGCAVSCYLPHRVDEGYGLSREGVENCLKKNPVKLLLALDCGSTAVESITLLRDRGVDVIVLDHHQTSSPLPPATALVNPRARARAVAAPPGADGEAPDSDSTELCSAGLAFKLAHALVKRGRETGLPEAAGFDLRPLLDLVALGTIADIVPLVGENRILVSAGLERLNATTRPGLLALKQVAQTPAVMGVHEVGFQLGPRLNAAGRLETAEEALQLLLARDSQTALPLALSLDARNRERQQIERAMVKEVSEVVHARFQPDRDFVIVEGQLSWHIGVVGIVASRILQQFYRPTIIVGGDGALWRGSGRSIAGFDLAAALRECGDLLARHGGHAMAAGLAIDPANLEPFRARLNGVARQALKPEDLQAPLRLDAVVRLTDLTVASLEELSRLKPAGQGNPAAQFWTPGLTLQRPPSRMGTEKQHVKLWVTDGVASHEAVWWNAGQEVMPAGAFDLAFVPQINDYNGRQSVQLKVLDWRPATSKGAGGLTQRA
jgi:single-stranded-DNA-specific exonuclease